MSDVNQAVAYQFQDAGYAARCAAEFSGTPFVVLRPRLFPDGDQWCALLGDNIQVGVVGFGDTPSQAANDFDNAWWHARTPDTLRAEQEAERWATGRIPTQE